MQQVNGRLLLVGQGGEEERLQALASELRLGERVVWLSHLENEAFLTALHACDVFAFPSTPTLIHLEGEIRCEGNNGTLLSSCDEARGRR